MRDKSELAKILVRKNGFTLIELIVVIAILGILAVVIVPKFAGFTKTAQHNSVLADAKTVQKAVATYYAQYGSLPDAADLTPSYLSGAAAAHVLTLNTGGTVTLAVSGSNLTGGFTYAKTINGTAYSAVTADSSSSITVTP